MRSELPENVPWRIRDILFVIGIFIVASLIATGIAFAITGIPEEGEIDREQIAVGIAATIAIDVVLLAAAVLFSVVKYRVPWRTLGYRLPRLGQWWYPFVTLLCLWTLLGAYVGIVSAFDIEQLQPNSTLDEDAFDAPYLVALAGILALVAAPLAEETFFRGFLFVGLRKRWGTAFAAGASGLLFGLLHFDTGSIIPFSLIGIALAIAYTISGSLWITIATHFLFNFVSFIATLAMQNGGGT